MDQLLQNFPNAISSKQKKRPPAIYAPFAPAPFKRRANLIETEISLRTDEASGYANEPFLHSSHHQPITESYLFSLRQSLDEIYACLHAALLAPRNAPSPGKETYTTTTHIQNAIRHFNHLIPALARLSSHPDLFPDPATARTFWNITNIHLLSIRTALAAYHRITSAWRTFAEGDDASKEVAHKIMHPLQRNAQGEIVPPWKTWLGVRAMTILPELMPREMQTDVVAISRAWDGYCEDMEGMREQGWVPLLVQVVPQQGVLLAEGWRLSVKDCIEAVASMSEKPEVVESLMPPDLVTFTLTTDFLEPSLPESDQAYIWITSPGTLPNFTLAHMTHGLHEKPAEQARMYCTHLGHMDATTRGDDRVLFRILMRRMTPEERAREEAFVAETSREEWVRQMEEMKAERESLARDMDGDEHNGAGAGPEVEGEADADVDVFADADVVTDTDIDADTEMDMLEELFEESASDADVDADDASSDADVD